MSKFDAIPDELKERDQWLLWDAAADTPRRPHWRGNFGISWSDPDDWHSFEAAVSAAQERVSWGIGYVMALDNNDHARGLYGCLDLDGCVEDPDGRRGPKDWLPSLGTFLDHDAYVEYSASGEGIHIPLVGQEPPDWWRDSHFSADEHEGVEFLTNKFVAFTGDKMPEAGDTVADTDPAPFLHEAYKLLNDESPVRQDSHDYDDSDHDDELSESQIRDALEHIDSSVPYPQWRDMLFAIHDWDAGSSGKSVAEDWSMGPGWDDQAEELIQKIWSGAEQGSGITVGTLIHKATENGWSPGRDETPAAGAEPNEDDEELNWADIRDHYRAAGNDDDRLTARYNASRKLMQESSWRTIEENDTLWKYDADAGIFRENGEPQARQRLDEKLREQYRAHEQSEIENKLRARTLIADEDFGGDANMVCTENCVLEIDDADITRHEHDPAYNFIGRVETVYDADADCPTFTAFLQDVVPDTETRQKLQEFAGYCLHHWGIPYHKSLFLVGPTASGKSTFLDTIRTMLGNDAVCSLTPQQMASERFGAAELHGSWANIRNDIPTGLIENTGQFKELIAGDPIKVEKKRKDPFMMEPTAKHLFSANELPETETDDQAFFRRIILAAFPTTVPRGERDPTLPAKLQAEHPGILNWALEGLQRLLSNGSFTGDRSPARTEETWAKWGNSVKRFAQACIKPDEENHIPTSEMFAAYLAYCDNEGIPAETVQQTVTKTLQGETKFMTGKKYIDGSQQRCFLDVGFTGRGVECRDADADESNAASGLQDY